MLANVEPSSATAIAILVVCLVLVLAFETTNGFHDTANAVATVIYSNSLQPTKAVIWSGVMNFIGVIAGGIAVAYALIELLYRILAEMKKVQASRQASDHDKAFAGEVRSSLRGSVEYAPFWVRLASALCLGIGTMFGYRRVVRTLGERLGRTHLTPAKGAAAELVSALLIGTTGFSGLPVSTTHIVTSGIAGTMLADRGSPGLRQGTVSRIVLAWVLTLPVTIGLAAGLFYVLD
jgi:phosphate/sulfate permease